MFCIFVRIAIITNIQNLFYFLWGNRNKTMPVLQIILFIKDSLQLQPGNIFENK